MQDAGDAAGTLIIQRKKPVHRADLEKAANSALMHGRRKRQRKV